VFETTFPFRTELTQAKLQRSITFLCFLYDDQPDYNVSFGPAMFKKYHADIEVYESF